MTGNGKRLGEEVCHVLQAANEEDMEVSLVDPVPDLVRRMSVALDIRWETVAAAMPMVTMLWQNNGWNDMRWGD